MKHELIWENLKFVTGNANKVNEARRILGVPLEQANLGEIPEIQTRDVVELVAHKLEQAYDRLRCPVMVEDSGLFFSAWNGLPGALVKWFEKSVGCEGMIKMLGPFKDREALAVCCVGLHDGRGTRIAKGEARGIIAPAMRGENGFGWDAIFIPKGHDRTFAEMSVEEKNAISHRQKAFAALKEML
ncbi:MAG: RdgB/HAM1 family non-canonical purine NTP pyrophosphatase [Nitrospinales bacterium]